MLLLTAADSCWMHGSVTLAVRLDAIMNFMKKGYEGKIYSLYIGMPQKRVISQLTTFKTAL